MNKNYDVDYFIRKFEAIPEEMWYVGSWGFLDSHCAGGHCGLNTGCLIEGTPESVALSKLLDELIVSPINRTSFRYSSFFWCKISSINDGEVKEYQQPTPKQRILAALYDIKKMNSEQEEERSVASKEQSELLQSETKRKNITKSLAVFPVEEKSDLKTLNEVV